MLTQQKITKLLPGHLYRALDFAYLPRKTNYCAVYVADMVGTPFVKVGSTSNVRSRFVSFQTASPFEISLPFILCPPVGVCHVDLEIRAHKALERHKVRNEWFRCSAQEAIDSILAICGIDFEPTQ